MSRALPIACRRSALLPIILAACLAAAPPRGFAAPPAPGGGAETGSPDVPAPATVTLCRLQVLDGDNDAPIPHCRVYREGPNGERRSLGETDSDGRLELSDPGQSGQRLIAFSLSYDAVNTDCPLPGETILRARLTRYATQNEEKAEIAAAAGDFPTASELSLEAARLARREGLSNDRNPASDGTPAPAATPGQGSRRAYHARPRETPPAPRATPGNEQSAQRYERQAYEYAARSLRLRGPATVVQPGTGGVEPSPELRRRIENLQRRERLPATGRLEAGVPSRLPRPQER